ncbi:alpha/beta fold hydrolase [Prauserella muralis]|uniref:Hydrolase n=1 Tax=Prauserella muralis TaxID=588067 RepID=A0A2V4AZ99_9PSEU|nr:alpha/beta fold hydrolase [Prauserella muralis]PXY27341.1 hydrolase [Prauserella muralis]
MTTTRANGITIGYDDEGTGDAVVLVHGHPFDRSMWRPQTRSLAEAGWRAIAPDLRGYGQSSVVPGSTSLETFARDILALLDRLRVRRFALAGLSMGGQIALELQRLVPDRIRALVLADTSPHAETPEGRVRRRAQADRLLAEGMRGYADEVLTTMIAPHTVETAPLVALHVSAMMRGAPPQGAAAALRGRAERRDYVDLLGRITVPTLVMVGSEDEFTPVEVARFLHERIPGSQLAIIEGAAHLPNLEREREFSEIVEKFLLTT